VSASLASSRDDYTDTDIGLRESKSDNFNIDTSLDFSENLSAHAFYSWQRIRSDQAGSETPTDPDWKVDYDDRIQSVGFGLIQKNAFTPKLDISFDYVYSDGKGSIDVNAPNSLVPVNPFPDSSTKVHVVNLSADYRIKRHTSVRVGYQFERYSSDDWAVDKVYPDSLQNVLTLGAETPDYNQHLFWASVVYKF
jgi:predicted porin